jgi:iron complex outermembrane recepter protein
MQHTGSVGLNQPPFFRKKLSQALLVGALGGLQATMTPAVQAASEVTRQVAFDIPAGALGSALNTFGQKANILLSFSPGMVAGRNTQGLQGRHGVPDGLSKLLQGTGLMAVSHADGSYSVQPAPASAMTLPDSTINARREENPWGPVDGYVARRSASATKSDTSLLEAPQAVTVITAQQIKDQAATTVGAALRYTPGVVAEQYGGTDVRLDRFMIRGFDTSMPYLDGLWTGGRYTLLAPSVDPYGLERVEVLRGPSSVMYGQNIPGGMVNLISKRPTDTPLHEVGVQVGNHDNKQLSFDLSDALNESGSLRYRLTGQATDSQTQVDHVKDDRYFIAPALTWQPDEDTTLTVLTHFQRQNGGMLSQSLPASASLHSGPYGRLSSSFFTGEPDMNRFSRNEYSLGYAFEHRFNDTWTVRQNLRYSHADTDLSYVAASGFIDDTSLLDRFSLSSHAWVKSIAVDTQAEARFATGDWQHTATFGVDYNRSHDRWTEIDGSASPLDILNPVYGQPFTLPEPDFVTDDTVVNKGLYAQDQVRLDHWVFTGSLRHDWADTTTRDLVADSKTDQNDSKTTGRAGVVYLFDNGLAPYASYSTSFQPSIGTNADSGAALKPTTGKQYEAGLKYQPPGQNSSVTLSAYELTQENVVTTNSLPPFNTTQSGEVRIRGLELSGVADLGDGLKGLFAYTLMNAKVTKDLSYEGNRPKDTPRQMASLWLDKTLQSGPLKGFGAGAGVRYVGQREGDQANDIKLPANTLFDGALHYDYKHWRASINATNLLDDKYVATCDNTGFCFYGLRRSVLGSLTYNW